jgi:hypothetical protein
MTTTRSSAYYAGLLPVPVRLTTLENQRFPNGQPSIRKRASRALSSLIAFCTGVAVIFAWWSYGDAARQMIASSYPWLGWAAPRGATTARKTPDMVAPIASAAPFPDQRQPDEVVRDLHAIRLSLDRIVAGQEVIARSIDEIATSIAASQELTRSTDETATSIAAWQGPTTRSTNQAAATVAADKGQMTRSTDQIATSIDQAHSKVTSITVESRTDGASLQPAARVGIKPSQAKLPDIVGKRQGVVCGKRA